MAESTTIHVRLPKEAVEKLDSLAQTTRRSRSFLAAEAILGYVDENAWQVKEIGQAVEKADQGGPFYAHEDVMTYLDARARGENPKRPKPIRTR
jgi:predicted transcriptional regulator